MPARKANTETALYEPVKRLLEGQGYEVKGEIGAADVVGLRGEEAPLIVELKTAFSLTLIHQAIARLSVTDRVYVAVPEWSGRAGWKAFQRNRVLCRRLGLGVITVNRETGSAHVHLDPGPYAPRQSKVKRARLLREFGNRVGDPNPGGTDRKAALVTAYRQQALLCLAVLQSEGPTKAAIVARLAKVGRARAIMSDNHYGWFMRVERGVYGLSSAGEAALEEYAHALTKLHAADEDDGRQGENAGIMRGEH